MKRFLHIAGVLAALAAVILAVAGANLDANQMPQDVHPNASIGMALAALALLKAGELNI